MARPAPPPRAASWPDWCYYPDASMLRQLGSMLPFEDIAVGARFFWSLPRFLRNPLSPQQAQAILVRRLEQRESDFLALIGRAVFAQPGSPYHQLLRLAGCEFGDLDLLVQREGVEGSLRELHRQG